MGSSKPSALEISLTQDSWKKSFTYALADHGVPLELDALGVLNLSTASSYTLTGKCDSSLKGQSLRVQAQDGSGVALVAVAPKQAFCIKGGDSANTFSVSFDLVDLSGPSIAFHVDYFHVESGSAGCYQRPYRQ